MQIFDNIKSSKAPSEKFTGEVFYDVIAGMNKDETQLRAWLVRFSPCSRTAWHTHALGQTLYITQGVGRVQERGGEVVEVKAGESIYTAPGVWHWHGASPETMMEHIAMWEALPGGAPAETTWGEHVTDEEYFSTPN